MSAAPYNLLIEQFAAFDRHFRYTDSAKLPVPLLGYEADMDIRLPNGDLVVRLTTQDGRIVLHPDNGWIRLKLPLAETSKMKFTKALYDLRLKPPGHEPFRLMQGEVTLSKGQTR